MKGTNKVTTTYGYQSEDNIQEMVFSQIATKQDDQQPKSLKFMLCLYFVNVNFIEAE